MGNTSKKKCFRSEILYKFAYISSSSFLGKMDFQNFNTFLVKFRKSVKAELPQMMFQYLLNDLAQSSEAFIYMHILCTVPIYRNISKIK